VSSIFMKIKHHTEVKNKKVLSQIESLNHPEIHKLIDTHIKTKPEVAIPKEISSVKIYSRNPGPKGTELYKKAQARGKALVAKGKVAAFLVAGGQGTRLGFEGPKGLYQVTPIKEKSLFQVFAEQLLAYSKDSETHIPWYIMTSEINHDATQQFFKDNNYFGYTPADIFFFKQGLMPAFSMDGELLLESPDSLALSPDGHGGSLRALLKNGALDDMHKRGVKYLSYFQVDNPIVQCIDYTFLGLHDLLKSEMSSKTIPKAGPLEKVGNFVVADGKTQVIEYSDMPEDLAKQTLPDGTLKFNAGSIAIHILSVSFIDRLHSKGVLHLPWHRAEKKVAHINETGKLIKPEKPNAIKLEQFIFDAIPLAKNPLVYETDRSEEFSPVKNAEGSDSPVTCRQHQINRAARWLTEAGVKVPYKDGVPDATIEIDPLFAATEEELKTRLTKISLDEIQSAETIYFGHEIIERSFVTPEVFQGRFRKSLLALQKLFTATEEEKSN
jgi:UDP-N-acetylglucosamine/UDP-N-acetylgalactosamine diphosphorylase